MFENLARWYLETAWGNHMGCPYTSLLIAVLKEVATWPCQSDGRAHGSLYLYGLQGTAAMMHLL